MSDNKQTTTSTSISLEGKTASRAFIRSHKSKITESDGLLKIDLSIIAINPGFNPRKKPEGMYEEAWEQHLMIPALADGIFENNGPFDPILGDIYAEDGKFYITEGERRYRAIRHLVAIGRDTYPNGKPVNIVKVMLLPAGTTDLERKRIALRSAEKMKLSVMQRAWYYVRFADEDNMTHEDIAKVLGVSRQTVDNYIMAARELPKEVQHALDEESISITNALAAHREKKKKQREKKADDDDALHEKKEAEAVRSEEKDNHDDSDIDEQQPDNSITFAGSQGGPKEQGSGAIVLGTDSIYMQQKKKELWMQMINRYENQKSAILEGNPAMAFDDKWQAELAVRLGNEYVLTVK